MDENFLLTLETLTLNREIVRGVSGRGVFAIKNRSLGTYLVVDDAQWATLEAFRIPQTVPQMLGRAVQRRTCLELSEFYELVVKAHDAGILTGGSTLLPRSPPPVVAKGIPFPSSLGLGWFIGALATYLGAVAIWPPQSLPAGLDWLYGWLILIVTLSLGNELAALVLQTARGEPKGARFIWASLLPRFHVDVGDACMRELPVRVAVAVMPVTPVLTAAAIGLILREGWAFVPAVAAMLLFFPGSPAVEGLRLFFGRPPRLDTEHRFLFSANRWPRRKLRAFLHVDRGASLIWYCLGGILWVWIALRMLYSVVGLSLSDTWMKPLFWQGVAAIVIVSLLLTGLIIFTALAAIAAKRRGARFITQTRRRARRWRTDATSALTEAELAKTLAQSPLLRMLDPTAQADVADHLTVVHHKAWTPLVQAGRPRGEVSIIAKGRARATRSDATGRKQTIQDLVEGDIFGAQELLDPNAPAFDVESRTPVVALSLPYADFEALVVKRFGPARANRLAHHCSFLRSLPLCAHWQLSSISRLADLAEVRSFEPGQRVVSIGDEPWTFYVIWEGEFELSLQGRVLAKMVSGDFIGETDLLQNSAAVITVTASQPTRALCVQRTDFLRFVTHNHHVALSLERFASERLGRPLFPLQTSFETH